MAIDSTLLDSAALVESNTASGEVFFYCALDTAGIIDDTLAFSVFMCVVLFRAKAPTYSSNMELGPLVQRGLAAQKGKHPFDCLLQTYTAVTVCDCHSQIFQCSLDLLVWYAVMVMGLIKH